MKRTAPGLTATALFTLIVAYAGVCGWMYARQRELMYFPQLTQVPAHETDFEVRRNGVTLRGWLVNPGQPGAIVYFGGNAERIELSRDEFAAWFPHSSVYLIPYRGYGASDGEPNEAALFADAVAVYDLVRARHAGRPPTVIGSSLGSGVAAYLASARPVPRLVLIAPFDSLANVAQAHYPLLPIGALLQDRFESTRYLAEFRNPVLVIRAGHDEVIPAVRTDRLISALPVAPQVVELAGAGHNTIRDDPRFGQALQGFVR